MELSHVESKTTLAHDLTSNFQPFKLHRQHFTPLSSAIYQLDKTVSSAILMATCSTRTPLVLEVPEATGQLCPVSQVIRQHQEGIATGTMQV